MSRRIVESLRNRMPLVSLALVLLAPWSLAWADSFEPNDTWQQAHAIPSGTPVESWISVGGDVDWYTFTTGETGQLTIRLESLPADYDIDLYWYDPDFQDLSWIASSYNGGAQDELIEGQLNLTGAFYIIVEGFEEAYSDSDSYLLTASYPGGVVNQPPQVTLTSPNGGQIWQAGSTHAITYVASDPETAPENLLLSFEYSSNNGVDWIPIAIDQPNTGSFDWTVPDDPTTEARVRVTVSDGQNQAYDASDASFTIQSDTPTGDNALSMGTGSGPSGAQIAVAMSLANENVVKALQTDIVFDPAVVSYVGGASTERGSGMTFSASVVDGDKVRVVMYYLDQATLPAGTGTIASLDFSLIGASGAQTALTPTATVLSDPNAQELEVETQAGSISIAGTAIPPVLQIAALKNPGRVRTVQIFVLSSQPLNSLAVTANGTQVAMSQIDIPNHIYHAIVHAANGATQLAIAATGTSGTGQGAAQAVVNF